MKIKQTQYRITTTKYLRYDGVTVERYEPQYRLVVLGVPTRWKSFTVGLTGQKGKVWFNAHHLAENYISVVQDRARRQ